MVESPRTNQRGIRNDVLHFLSRVGISGGLRGQTFHPLANWESLSASLNAQRPLPPLSEAPAKKASASDSV